MSGGAFFTGLGAPSITNGTLSLPGTPGNPATGTVVNPIAPVTAQGLTQNAPIIGRQPTTVSNDPTVDVNLPEISVGPSAPIAGTGTQTTQQQNILPTTTPTDTSGGGTGTAGSGTGTDTGSGSGTGTGSDTSVAGTAGAASGSGVSGQGGFVDNPLNGYRQVAYHFKLYCAGDTGQGNQVIIAETGKTGFNIREVHINSIVAPNQWTINTQTTEFTMVVTEPTGVAFLDAMYVGAAASGVQHNWNTCPYMLDLTFTGYNEDGSIVPQITQGMPNSGKLTWKVNITTIDTVLETGGAIYTIHGIMQHDTALTPEFGATQANHTVTGKTVQEVCDALTNQVNKKILQDYKEQIASYQFVFHGGGQSSGPNPSSYTIKQQNGQTDPFRLFSMDQGSLDQPTANIVRGTQLTQFVDQVIGATIEGQSLAAYGKVGGDLTKIPTGGNFAERIHYRVYPEVTYSGKYNETYGQYLKTVKLHVKPYKTQVTVLDAQEAKKAGQDAWNAVKPRTRKQYQYIFTGQNTEVITFDLKFSMVWNGNLPRFAGWEMQNEMVEHHAVYDKQGVQNFKAYNDGRNNAVQGAAQAQQGASTVGVGNALSTGNPFALLTTGVQNAIGQNAASTIAGKIGSLFGGPATGTATTPSNSAGGILGAFTQNGGSQGSGGANVIQQGLNMITAGNNLASSSEAALKQNAAALAAQQKASGLYQNVSSGTFAEDLLGTSTQATLPYQPLTLAQGASASQRANGSGFVGQRGLVGRSIYGALLDQLYFPDVLSTINLTVRGDPFWLGGQYENNFGETSKDQNSADFTQGDTCFALVFRYPYGIDETSGQPSFKPQNTFNGAYRATKIMHDFVDGKFTQTIEAIRLAKVDPNTINSAVGSNNASSSSGSSGSNPATTASGVLNALSGAQSSTTSSTNQTNTSTPSQVPSAATGTVASVPSMTTPTPNSAPPIGPSASLPIFARGNASPTNVATPAPTVDLSSGSDSDWS